MSTDKYNARKARTRVTFLPLQRRRFAGSVVFEFALSRWLPFCNGRFGFIEPGSRCLGVAIAAAYFSTPSLVRQPPLQEPHAFLRKLRGAEVANFDFSHKL